MLLVFDAGFTQVNPNDYNLSPNGFLEKVIDKDGNVFKLKDILIDKTRIGLNQSQNNLNCSCTTYFNLFFENNCGMEDINNALHNQRRAVVCKVFEDISNFIISPLANTGKKVNIRVNGLNTAGILGAASSFYIQPTNSSNTIGGILEGEVWKTIHLGTDSYNNVSENNLFYHGKLELNFSDPNIVWHTDLSTSAPVDKYDLYTVVLHEILHALGFNSFMNQNGISITGSNFFTRFDTFLKTNTNQSLILNASCNNWVFNSAIPLTILRPGCSLPNNLNAGLPANSTSCTNPIMFSGASNVPVYRPTCFELGSSLSHFEDGNYPNCTSPLGNDDYFVTSNVNKKGSTKRYLKPEERNTLCDIGYALKTTFGSNTTNNGYYNYGGTSCNGINVAGRNDGINPDNTYYYIATINTVGGTSTNVAINGNYLLGNDLNASSFDCLQDIIANANLSGFSGTNITTINFNTTTSGLHLLSYIPVNGTIKGNITYFYIYVIPAPTAGGCSPAPSACDLVMNGDFEQYSVLPSSIYQIEKACGWQSVFPILNTT